MNTKKKTMTRSRRPKNSQVLLKTMLALGSVVATLLGTELLAALDNTPTSIANPVPIVESMEPNYNPYLPSDQPLPKLTIPDPVTRSRSS